MSSLPRIAITMGDPAGVGPELCLRALAESGVHKVCTPQVYGDLQILREAAQRCQLPQPRQESLVDFARIAPDEFTTGEVSPVCGAASFAYIDRAIRDALD